MIFNVCKWLWMNGNDCEWMKMIVNELKWLRMNENDCEWKEMIVNECRWLWMNGNDCEWMYMIVNEWKWLWMNGNDRYPEDVLKMYQGCPEDVPKMSIELIEMVRSIIKCKMSCQGCPKDQVQKYLTNRVQLRVVGGQTNDANAITSHNSLRTIFFIAILKI